MGVAKRSITVNYGYYVGGDYPITSGKIGLVRSTHSVFVSVCVVAIFVVNGISWHQNDVPIILAIEHYIIQVVSV